MEKCHVQLFVYLLRLEFAWRDMLLSQSCIFCMMKRVVNFRLTFVTSIDGEESLWATDFSLSRTRPLDPPRHIFLSIAPPSPRAASSSSLLLSSRSLARACRLLDLSRSSWSQKNQVGSSCWSLCIHGSISWLTNNLIRSEIKAFLRKLLTVKLWYDPAIQASLVALLALASPDLARLSLAGVGAVKITKLYSSCLARQSKGQKKIQTRP